MYPSDINDEEWEIISKFVKGSPNTICRRLVIDAIFYQNRTVCQWNSLPKDFPNYKVVNEYYNKWIRRNVWEKMHKELVLKCRSAMGKKSRRANGRYN